MYMGVTDEKTVISVVVEKKTKKKLQKLAKEDKRSLSSFIAKVLDDFLKKR